MSAFSAERRVRMSSIVQDCEEGREVSALITRLAVYLSHMGRERIQELFVSWSELCCELLQVGKSELPLGAHPFNAL